MIKRKKMMIVTAVLCVIIFFGGYLIGQIPMLNNKAEKLDNMQKKIDESFYKSWISLSFSMGTIHDEALDYLDQAMGYLLNSIEMNGLREHVHARGAYALGLSKEECVSMYDYLFHLRILTCDAVDFKETNTERLSEIKDIIGDLRYVLYYINDEPIGTTIYDKSVYDKFFAQVNSANGQLAMKKARNYCEKYHKYTNDNSFDRHNKTHQ